MHHLNILTQKRQRPLKGCARATLLRKCFVGKYMDTCRDAHTQVTNLMFAKNQGGLYLDFFNLEPRITTHEYKINPSLYKVWVDLLKEVPGSVLWVMKLNEGAHNNLTQSARDHGVDPERIIFASPPPRMEDHLVRYRLADVFIETFSYNGHTIAGDALRAGLTVAILYGGSFASRVAASLIHDVGMPKLACYSFQDYHDMTLQMATDEVIRSLCITKVQLQVNSNLWLATPLLQTNATESLIKVH
jgi:protein O-GlcNAc transferase